MDSPAYSNEPRKPAVMKADYTPSVLLRQDSEVAGCAKPRRNQLGGVKMPYVFYSSALNILLLSAFPNSSRLEPRSQSLDLCF